jgi:hypothetical protein
MLRPCLLLFGMTLGSMLSSAGCQSCSNCHDYDSPVANCHCGHCPQRGCDAQTGQAIKSKPAEDEGAALNGDVEPTLQSISM